MLPARDFDTRDTICVMGGPGRGTVVALLETTQIPDLDQVEEDASLNQFCRGAGSVASCYELNREVARRKAPAFECFATRSK
jgi:hypothetical protein